MGWATSIPFASINSTDPRTNPQNFHKKNWRIGDFEKLSFLESAILDFFFKIFFFLLHPHENWSKFLGYQGWVKLLMITLVSNQKSLPLNISAGSVVWSTLHKFNKDISFHPLIKTHTLIFRKIPVFTEQWNHHKCILDLLVQDTLAQYNYLDNNVELKEIKKIIKSNNWMIL